MKVARMELYLGDSAKTSLIADDVQWISVSDQLDMTSTLRLVLPAWDTVNGGWLYLDEGPIFLGQKVELKLGYDSKLATVFFGEITDLELEWSSEQAPTLSVLAQDVRFRMGLGEHGTIFQNKKDSQIASDILGKYATQVDTIDTATLNPSVCQGNISDLAFLNQRAELNDYALAVVGRTVRFVPRSELAKTAFALDPEADLLSFAASVASARQVTKAQIRGLDANKKELAIELAAEPLPGIDSRDVLPKTAPLIVTARDDEPEDTVRARAKHLLRKRNEGVLTAQATCYGNPDLHAGCGITFVGDQGPPRFSQKYQVMGATHSFSADQGYRTSLELRAVSP